MGFWLGCVAVAGLVCTKFERKDQHDNQIKSKQLSPPIRRQKRNSSTQDSFHSFTDKKNRLSFSGLKKKRINLLITRFLLKCHWDQNFGIPCFYIFEHSLWFLVTMPNFNLLRRLEVAFFGRFLSRFCGRHYWPLFRKLACE